MNREEMFARLEASRVISDTLHPRDEEMNKAMELVAFMAIVEGRTISKNDALKTIRERKKGRAK